jgi:hypothetical protein
MKINNLITEIQRPEQTGHKLCNRENKAPFLSATPNHPLKAENSPYSHTLHALRGAL